MIYKITMTCIAMHYKYAVEVERKSLENKEIMSLLSGGDICKVT